MSNENNEVYLGLVGKWLYFSRKRKVWIAKGLWSNSGSPFHVDFNPRNIINREINHQDIIGFYHTHIRMPGYPSSTDITTMNSWVNCLGKPLICLINGNSGLKCYYWVDDNTFRIGKAYKYKNLFFGVIKGEHNQKFILS
jgi:hypothetical protein